MAERITVTVTLKLLNKPVNQKQLRDVLSHWKQNLMKACKCMPISQANTAYHLLNHYNFKINIDDIRTEMATWAHQDDKFLRSGLCNVTAKCNKTHEQLIGDALKIDAPASDVTLYLLSQMCGKTIGVVCSV